MEYKKTESKRVSLIQCHNLINALIGLSIECDIEDIKQALDYWQLEEHETRNILNLIETFEL